MSSSWTSRKLWIVMFWEAVATVSLWFGKLDSGGYVTLTSLLIGGYMAANVMQKKSECDNDVKD